VDADLKDPGASEHILALNRSGVSFLDLITHETLIQYPFTEVTMLFGNNFKIIIWVEKLRITLKSGTA
jgi:hypothetical protein